MLHFIVGTLMRQGHGMQTNIFCKTHIAERNNVGLNCLHDDDTFSEESLSEH